MSIASEITRLQNAKADLKTAIENKGVNVPSNAKLDDYDTYVANIPAGQALTIQGGSDPGYVKMIEDFNEVTIEGTSAQNLFSGFPGKTIPRINGTGNVTAMNSMFNNCTSVTSYDFSNFDTSKVTNMNSMFYCQTGIALRRLDVSSFDTSHVLYASSMFRGLYQLAVLDISSFDFSSMTSFSNMFNGCGTQCLASDGAYADKIPYVYVKDATAQTWVLTQSNGHPASWSTNNVLIKSQVQQ